MTIRLRLKNEVDKMGRSAIRWDVSHTDDSGKKIRKLINTQIKVKKNTIDVKNWRVKPNNNSQDDLNIALEEIKEKINKALNKFETKQFTIQQVFDYLSGKASFNSVDDYIDTVIKESRSSATYIDYKNTLNAFKKHIKTPLDSKISFNEFSSYEVLDKFKRNALKNGAKGSTINSYFNKIRAILNDAYNKKYIHQKFELNKGLRVAVIPTRTIDTITTTDFEKGIEKAKSIYDAQALGLYLLMFGLRGMYQADIVALKDAEYRCNDFPKNSPYHLIFNDGKKYIIHRRNKTKNKANDDLIIRIDDMIPSLIKMLKSLFKITHKKKGIISSNNLALFDYDLDDQSLHKNIWDVYQKRIKKLIGVPFKTARKTYNTFATELEVSDTIKNILLGHAPTTIADKHYTNRRTVKISERVQQAHTEILDDFEFKHLSMLLYFQMANYNPKAQGVLLKEIKKLQKWKKNSHLN